MVIITDLTISTNTTTGRDILTMTAFCDKVLQGITFIKDLEYGPWTNTEIALVEKQLGELFSLQYEEHLGKILYFTNAKEPRISFRGRLVGTNQGGLYWIYTPEASSNYMP